MLSRALRLSNFFACKNLRRYPRVQLSHRHGLHFVLKDDIVLLSDDRQLIEFVVFYLAELDLALEDASKNHVAGLEGQVVCVKKSYCLLPESICKLPPLGQLLDLPF